MAANNDMLFYGSRSHQVARMNLNGNPNETLTPFESPHYDTVTGLTVFKDYLVSGSRDKTLKLWSLDKDNNKNIYNDAHAHKDWINALLSNKKK